MNKTKNCKHVLSSDKQGMYVCEKCKSSMEGIMQHKYESEQRQEKKLAKIKNE